MSGSGLEVGRGPRGWDAGLFRAEHPASQAVSYSTYPGSVSVTPCGLGCSLRWNLTHKDRPEVRKNLWVMLSWKLRHALAQ